MEHLLIKAALDIEPGVVEDDRQRFGCQLGDVVVPHKPPEPVRTRGERAAIAAEQNRRAQNLLAGAQANLEVRYAAGHLKQLLWMVARESDTPLPGPTHSCVNTVLRRAILDEEEGQVLLG